MRLVRSWSSCNCLAFSREEKYQAFQKIQTVEWLTLNCLKILQVKLLRFSPPPPALIKNSLKPWQNSPLQLVFYPFQLSWLGYLESLGGLFILIDTYWIRGKRVWRLRNKSWILSSSFCTVESRTKQREEMLRKFVQRTPVIPHGKGAFSEECISLLIFQDLRQSLLLFFSFCHICWHFLHWWCGWGNGLLHLFLRFIPESLLLKNLFICLLMLSLETLENVSAETNNN